MKKDILRFSFVLGIIAVVTAFGVSGVYQVTRTRIEQKEKVAFDNALKAIFPEATAFAPLAAGNPAEGEKPAAWDQKGVARAMKDSTLLGYLAVGEKQGYSSKIKVLVACEPSGAVKEVRVLYAAETPGLGERAKEVKSEQTLWQVIGESVGLAEKKPANGLAIPWFQAQFAGKTLDKLVVVKGQTAENIQAITAATVTSRAVTGAVKSAVEEIQKAMPPQSAAERR